MKKLFLLSFIYVFLGLISLVFYASQAYARAGVSVCNQGSKDVFIAVVSEPGLSHLVWDADGWYAAKPGKCVSVVCNLKYTYYLAFIKEGRDGSWGSFVYRPASGYNSDVKSTQERFCVKSPSGFSRRGSLPFLGQCPPGYKLAQFSLLVSKPVCYDVYGSAVSDANCIASLTLDVNVTGSTPLIPFAAG